MQFATNKHYTFRLGHIQDEQSFLACMYIYVHSIDMTCSLYTSYIIPLSFMLTDGLVEHSKCLASHCAEHF